MHAFRVIETDAEPDPRFTTGCNDRQAQVQAESRSRTWLLGYSMRPLPRNESSHHHAADVNTRVECTQALISHLQRLSKAFTGVNRFTSCRREQWPRLLHNTDLTRVMRYADMRFRSWATSTGLSISRMAPAWINACANLGLPILGKTGTELRRARTDCSGTAMRGGLRDPMTTHSCSGWGVTRAKTRP
jgi:hypothetical protein